jgi:magnesium transporter
LTTTAGPRHSGRMAEPTVVNCAAYEDGRRVADISVADISEALKVPGRFVWVGLREPDEALLREIQVEFGLHDLAVEDALRAHQRPKVEQYGDTLFVVLRTARMAGTPPRIELGETHLFVGPRFVVSVRHGASASYTEVRAHCEAAPQLLARGPGFVLYAIMDFIVDQYFPIVDALEEQLGELEEEIFGGELNRQTTERIYLLKRDLVTFKRAVSPLVDVCNRLMRFDLPLIPEDTRPYIRDVYDHSVRINEVVDTLRELLTSALEANLSLVSVAQKESMKRLAGWAAIIAVPTMIAGIYGMNFKFMPELESPLGYPLAVAVMGGACGYLYVRFRRSGWL